LRLAFKRASGGYGYFMTAKKTRVLLTLGAVAAGLVVCLLGLLLVLERSGAPVALPRAAVGGPFQLIDQSGQTVSNQNLKGHPFIVFFGFTHCPDFCPTALFEMSEILTRLGPDADKVAALFVTVDPERDTPAAMKDYLSSFDPHLRGLTGSPQAIAAMLKEYRVYAKKVPQADGDYTMDHSTIVYLMDKDGQFVSPFNLKRRPEEAAADLRRYL
jgi:protein SCO1/2